MSKQLGSIYRRGRSPLWLTIKNPNAPAVKREAEEGLGALISGAPSQRQIARSREKKDHGSMNVSVEASGENLRQRLLSLFTRCEEKGLCVSIQLLDGTVTEIDPKKEDLDCDITVGVDYICVELVFPGGTTHPRIIPFGSIQSFYWVD